MQEAAGKPALGGFGRLSTVGLDQVLSSLTNFVATVLIARSGTIQDVGLFALAFSFYLLGLGVGRASVSEPLMIAVASGRTAVTCGGPPSVWAPLWVSLVPCLIVGGTCLLAGLTISAVVVFASPLLWTQDVLRYLALGRGTPRAAVVSDGAWLATIGAGAVWVNDPATAAGLWVVGGIVGAVTLSASLHCSVSRPTIALEDARLHGRGLSTYLGIDSLATSLFVTAAVPVGIGAIDLAELGRFRAVNAILGVIGLAFAAWQVFVLPLLSQASERSRSLLASRASSGVMIGGLTALIVLIVLAPWLGGWLMGDSTIAPRWMVAIVGVHMLLTAASAPIVSTLKTLRCGQTILLARSLGLVVGVGVLAAGLVTRSTVTITAALPVCSLLMFLQMRIRVRRPEVPS